MGGVGRGSKHNTSEDPRVEEEEEKDGGRRAAGEVLLSAESNGTQRAGGRYN